MSVEIAGFLICLKVFDSHLIWRTIFTFVERRIHNLFFRLPILIEKLPIMKARGMLLFLSIFFVKIAQGQTAKPDSVYCRTNPVWIGMLDSASINFYDIENAFRWYWMGRELPRMENETFETKESASEREKERRKKRKKHISEKERKEEEYNAYLAFQYKKYIDWRESVRAYVQEDGHVLSPSELYQIWKEQQK